MLVKLACPDTICYSENQLKSIIDGVLVFETTGYNNVTDAFKVSLGGRTTVSQSSGTNRYILYILNYTSVDGTGQIQTNKQDGYL
jgi:hypothetical protein